MLSLHPWTVMFLVQVTSCEARSFTPKKAFFESAACAGAVTATASAAPVSRARFIASPSWPCG
jgi:hypothetical protein